MFIGGGSTGFKEVKVNSDWATAANIWTDIKAATGIADPDGSKGFYISLWEGPGDPDDIGLYMFNGVMNSQYGFTTPPTSGTARIVGLEVISTD